MEPLACLWLHGLRGVRRHLSGSTSKLISCFHGLCALKKKKSRVFNEHDFVACVAVSQTLIVLFVLLRFHRKCAAHCALFLVICARPL